MFRRSTCTRAAIAATDLRCIFTSIAFILSWLGWAAVADCQSPELPRLEYYIARDLYEAGNISEATERFRVAMSRGQQINQQRWIDSVPPLVMLGECYYQQGAIAQALEQYDAALMVVHAFPTWIDTVRSGDVQPESTSELKSINWAKLSRRTPLVRVPRTVQVSLDALAAKTAVGGAQVLRVDVAEVLRCLSIALQRRSQLLGPLAAHSPLSQPMVQLFSKAPQAAVPWVQASWRALHGLAQLSVGDEAHAQSLLIAGSTIDNQSDYFLTPQCLLALAHLDVKHANDASALRRLADASLRSAQLEQADALADSLMMIGQLASAGRRNDLLGTLQSAAAWSQNYVALPFLSGSVAVSEVAAVTGNLQAHEASVKQSLNVLNGKDIILPRLQAQLGYAMARAAAAQNRLGLAEQQLETSMSMLRGNAATGAATRRVFQTQLTLELFSRNQIDVATADEVFGSLLGEPAESEWRLWPLECLVSVSTAHLPAYEKWLELVQRRESRAEVVDTMDALQRERFYEVLPLGGRLLALRHQLARDKTEWSPQISAKLEPLLNAYPAVSTVSQSMREALDGLNDEPLAIEDRTISVETKKKLAEIEKLSTQQENLLMSLALSRSVIPRHFPAPTTLDDLQQALSDRDVVLAFGRTQSAIVGTAISQHDCLVWSVSEPSTIDVKTSLLLTQIGLSGAPNLDMTRANVTWRATAAQLATALLSAEARDLISDARRLIIVPNGNLWYLPFELLPATESDPRTPLLARHAICYLPTLAHVSSINAAAPETTNTIGVFNTFFSSDRETNQDLSAEVCAASANALRLDAKQKGLLSTPSLLRLCADQLWVACEIPMTKTAWELRLIPIEPSQENALANWMQSPLRAPARLFLPGLQSSAQRVEMHGGNEIFVPACTLMTAGARSVWLSRWKVGGRSAHTALARIIDELDVEPPSTAWQRTALALWAEKFATIDEPVLPSARGLPANIDGNHPLLWSGYMMLGDHLPPQ